MNRISAVLLGLAASLALVGCSHPVADSAPEPVLQPSARPNVVASDCPATSPRDNKPRRCLAPSKLEFGSFRIQVNKDWIASNYTEFFVDLSRPDGYNTVRVMHDSALVLVNPGKSPAVMLREVVGDQATDLKAEPAPIAATEFQTAAYSYQAYGRSYYTALLVHGDDTLIIQGYTAYPLQDGGLYQLNVEQVLLGVSAR